MPVTFPLEKGKPPSVFYFDVITAQQLEDIGGANPAFLAAQGKQVTALVLMTMYGLKHTDDGITQRKAQRLIQKYLKDGGKTKPLMDALVKALNESGVYGDPDDVATADEDDAADPT